MGSLAPGSNDTGLTAAEQSRAVWTSGDIKLLHLICGGGRHCVRYPPPRVLSSLLAAPPHNYASAPRTNCLHISDIAA